MSEVVKDHRYNRFWDVEYVWAKPGRSMPICGMPNSGFIRVEAVGVERKARARAIATICKKHIIDPANVTIISIKSEDPNAR